MADGPTLTALRLCMNEAHGKKDRDECEKAFTDAGGTAIQDGGKVFTPPAGEEGQAFVTHGGKVFG